MQRNHQKVIEESPSAVVDEELREKMGQAAVLAAKAAGYKNAGTIEFLLEKDKSFYFMEMNTRIQVEHPVTEWVTGIDLIKAQIRIADGEKLKWKQEDIQITGHVLEELPICIFQVEKVFVLTVQSTVDVKYPHTMIL